MKRMLIAVAALALAACSALDLSAVKNPFQTAPTPAFNVTAAGTLEPLGSCGHAIAAHVSANALVRNSAASKIRAGRMSKEDGLQVLQLTDQARRFLAQACAAGQDRLPKAAAVDSARALIAQANQITERAK